MTAAIDSRLGVGTLTLGATEYGVQVSNVRLVPNHTENDGTPTLANPEPDSEVVTKWALQGTAIQDFEDVDGFVQFCTENNGDSVTFTWVPKTSAVTNWTGNCIIKAVEFGGDVNVQNTSDFEFMLVGAPVRADA